MKKKLKKNSLFFKILCVVVIGIICVFITVSYIIINISKNFFSETYSNSQKKIFNQVNDNMYNFHGEIVKVINSVSSNKAFKTYLTKEDLSIDERFKTIYQIKTKMKNALAPNNYNIDIVIMGVNGTAYLNRSEILTSSPQEILDMDISKNILKNNNKIIYQYLEKGFTALTNDGPVIVIGKALNLNYGEQYGIIYFTIKEKEFEKIYNYFNLDINNVVVLDQNYTVLSSNSKKNLGIFENDLSKDIEELKLKNEMSKSYKRKRNTVMIQRLPYCNLTICGTVDDSKALAKMYDMGSIVGICSLITLCILIVIFLIIKQMTKPLYLLTKKMGRVKDGVLDEYIEVSGPQEVRELSSTFNYMIEGLNKYVNELVRVQKEKRVAEINALQMQINPHYIFNTLASVKWLIRQGDNNKALEALDSFIILLRNSISKTDELITVEEEIENTKSYVSINNIRYGDRIKVEYFIMADCNKYLVPKLILQPFIENSFFHAFPLNEEGRIQVFIREQEKSLKIEICDNGIGIEEETLERVKEKKERKKEHFSGIGINNVDDRIKLIYGNQYGIEIKNKEKKGTRIIISLPTNALNKDNNDI